MAPGKAAAPGTPRSAASRRAHGELLVARRYLEHGFLDAAMRLFARSAAEVDPVDWQRLVGGLMQRGRVAEAVRACRLGGVPLPREELLALGDRHLRLKDVDAAVHYYELADADRARWSGLVDVLAVLPGRELQALDVAERRLAPAPPAPALRAAL
jgi:hypothetical protein